MIRRYSEFLKTRTMIVNGTLDPGPLSGVSAPLFVDTINRQAAVTGEAGGEVKARVRN